MCYTTLNPLQMWYTTLNPLQMCYTTESNSSVLVQCSVPHLHSTYMYVHVHGNSDQCYTVAVMQWVLARLLLVRLSYLCVCLSASASVYCQVFAAVQRVWLFRWMAVLMGVAMAVVVAPVAGLCDLFFRLVFSLFTWLGLSRPPQPPSSSFSRSSGCTG